MTIENVGNRSDYAFGCAEGWSVFEVVRFHGTEEISRLYEFDIVLLRRADKGPADLDTLIDSAVSLRIASGARWRVVHGIVAEAEEIDRTSTLVLYRVLLVPHLVRACHRKRCRNFVDTKLSDILTTVLENKSPAFPNGNQGLGLLSGDPEPPPAEPSFDSFTPPTASYRFSITDDSRIQDPTNSPYIVQYNETDFDFLNRLLEKEGISYYFEQAAGGTVMTLTDTPGQAPLFSSDESFDLRGVSKGGGSTRDQEVVRSLRDARRLRSTAVTVREYDWHRSHTPFNGSQQGAGDADRLGIFEFGTEDENSATEPGSFPAKIRLERLAAEGALREGTSTIRTKEPGYKFTVHDADGFRDDVELLLVRIETWMANLFPEGTVLDHEPFGFGGAAPTAAVYENRFVVLPTSVPFRPALRTPKHRIAGVQPAIVTAEEFSGSPPEINADKNGSVRLRFPWDQRPNTGDGLPTSNWIRVSQLWAGAGYGGLSTPRVGHEVLVAFVHGDPDRPIIVGRVHNPQSTPPYDASTQATRTSIKSQSSPNAQGSNEIRFEDAAGSEEVMIHAQFDMNEIVENNHTVVVNVDETINVLNNQTNVVGVNLTQQVGGDESDTVTGNQTISVTGNQSTTVNGNQDNAVSGNQSNNVTGNRTQGVSGNEAATVGGTYDQTVTGSHTTTITGFKSETVAGLTLQTANGGLILSAPFSQILSGDSILTSGTNTTMMCSEFTLMAGSASLKMSAGFVSLDNGAGASITMAGPLIIVSASIAQIFSSATIIVGGGASIGIADDINATGGTIKLNN